MTPSIWIVISILSGVAGLIAGYVFGYISGEFAANEEIDEREMFATIED